jgi:hypothetical protein
MNPARGGSVFESERNSFREVCCEWPDFFRPFFFTERIGAAVADEIEGEGGGRVGWFDAQYIWRGGLASAYSRVTFE